MDKWNEKKDFCPEYPLHNILYLQMSLQGLVNNYICLFGDSGFCVFTSLEHTQDSNFIHGIKQNLHVQLIYFIAHRTNNNEIKIFCNFIAFMNPSCLQICIKEALSCRFLNKKDCRRFHA